MSSALGDKKGRVADSSDLTRLQRESAVLAAYTTYTGLSVNKKANQQLGNDRKFTLGRGGLTLISESTTGFTRNPITGNIVLPPYTSKYQLLYAIPDFSTATYVSGDSSIASPYVVSSGGQQYSVIVSSVFADQYEGYGGQRALIRTTDNETGWISAAPSYDIDGNAVGDASYIQITAPTSFVLSTYSLATGFNIPSAPISWTLNGSTDGGATFTTIDTQTGQNLTDLPAIYTYSLPYNISSYNVYRLVINRIQPSPDGAHSLAIRQFNLFTSVLVPV
jgi:hypothetical protein